MTAKKKPDPNENYLHPKTLTDGQLRVLSRLCVRFRSTLAFRPDGKRDWAVMCAAGDKARFLDLIAEATE